MDFATVVCVGVGLVQLPFLLDLLDAAYPGRGIGRVNHAVLSRLLVLLLFSLMVSAYGVFLLFFVPHLRTEQSAVAVAGQAVGLSVVWGVGIFHFARAALADPAAGAPPPAADAPLCKHCGQRKAPHTHHCMTCNVCVPHMDHHCPFTKNCAGFNTFGSFYLFLLCATAGLIYGAAVSFAPFATCWLDLSGKAHAHPTCLFFGNQSLAFLTAVALLGATASLLALHTVLLCANYTTMQAVAFAQAHGPLALLRELFVVRVWQRRAFAAENSRVHLHFPRFARFARLKQFACHLKKSEPATER